MAVKCWEKTVLLTMYRVMMELGIGCLVQLEIAVVDTFSRVED